MISIKSFWFKSNNNSLNTLNLIKYFSDYKSVKNNQKLIPKVKEATEKYTTKSDVKTNVLQSPQQYCIDCVKKYDFENYLATILLKTSSVRRNAFAIRAFNTEISQIRDMTSTQLMAQIRLQYWSDLIDEIFADNSMIVDINQPIACELQRFERNAKLSKHWFKRLIESRMNPKNLSDFPFNTFEDLEKYCDSSVTPVYYLIVESSTAHSKVAANKRIDLDHICSHLGRAQGITNVLRGVLHNARYNRCYIPSDLLIKHKTSHEDFLRTKPTEKSIDLCFEMASNANQHIKTVSTLIEKVDKQNRLIFLPLVSVQNYLKRLEKTNFNIFDPKLNQRNGFLPFILWYNSKFL